MSVHPRVFISYSHDSHVSGAHRERVLALAQALRTHGIDVDFDQFHETEIVDWPSWCRRGLGPCNAERTQGSDFVLCVCSQGYFDGIENLVPPERNKGVYWEGRLLQQRMYDDKGNGRYLPVLLDGAPLSVIPEVLRGWTRVELGRFDPDDPDYEMLLCILSGEHPVIPVELGAFPDLRRFATHQLPEHGARLGFIGRQPELAALNAAWAEAGRTRLLTLIAPGGTGKTALVLHWLAGLRDAGWGEAQRVFGWSFYSQGTAEDRQASEEPFLRAALEFFRVQLPENASAYEKGEKLAAAIARSRTLLILDGLEPLQAALGGSLRAAGVATLLQALVRNARADQPCLCVLTSRQPVIEFAAELRDAAHPLRPVQTIPLDNLSPADGALLLYRLGVQRAGQGVIAETGAAQEAELQQASEAFKNHALTLTVLGNYLASAWHGDVRRWREVELAAVEPDFRFDADAEYGHAFKAMFAYERWLASDPRKGTKKLAVLRLLGLFDRPATPDCLRALLRAPVIDGLTEALSGIPEAEWNTLLADLRTAGLVQTAKWQPVAVVGYGEELARAALAAYAKNTDYPLGPPQAFTPPGPPLPAEAETLDAHPLLREYFAKRLADSAPEAARAGHARLYEHLSASVPYWPEGDAGLAPLYQAVAHGCRAGRYQEACIEVYEDRISRRGEAYAVKKLGLYGTELSAVAHFFREPWRTPVAAPALSDSDRAWLLNEAAFRLRALGRLTEAVEPMQAGLEMRVEQQNWKSAAIAANNLSELQQTLGALRAAIAAGEAAVRHADASGEWSQRMRRRTTLAEARQQAGETAAALSGLAEAEALQGQWQPQYPRLYSLQGFRYCDALLQSAERTAWAAGTGAAVEAAQRLERLAELQAVGERAAQTLAWAERHGNPLAIGLDHLTQARVSLYRSRLLAASDPPAAAAALQAATMATGQAVDGLRKAGADEFIVRGLLTRACVHALNADADAARTDLDAAQRIAERGGMKLHLADVHLHRARLFNDRTALAAARKLIDETGYERRRGELDDAQCRLDGQAVVLPEFASVLAQARGENLPEPPAGISWQRELKLLPGKMRLMFKTAIQNSKRFPWLWRDLFAVIVIPVVLSLIFCWQFMNIPLKRIRQLVARRMG